MVANLAISVVIPAYNEASVIGKTLNSTKSYLSDYHPDIKWEIIVVNDGSSDSTAAEVRKHEDVQLVNHPENYGKGKAVRTGYESAQHSIVVVMDADDSIPIKNIQNVWPYINDYHCVVASRYLNKSSANWPSVFRRMMSKTFSQTVRILFNLSVTDSQCGFKVFKKPFFDDVFEKATINGWAYDVEVLALASKKQLKVKDFPVEFVPGKRPSKVNYLKTSWQMLSQIISLKLKLIWGAYE